MQDQLYNFYILHQRKYKENSLLASVFTSEFGKVSAVIRTTKKTANLYQPLVKLRGQIVFAKKGDGLSKIYNVEFVESFYQKTYLNLLSLQYVNELIYLLLNYSHEENVLFKKYNFLLNNIEENNYKYLLRMFELELLESLGRGIYIDSDIEGNPIQKESSYIVLNNGFRKNYSTAPNDVLGKSLLKINEPITTWSEDDLKSISRVARACIDYALDGKQLKSRKLLVDYLNLQR